MEDVQKNTHVHEARQRARAQRHKKTQVQRIFTACCAAVLIGLATWAGWNNFGPPAGERAHAASRNQTGSAISSFNYSQEPFGVPMQQDELADSGTLVLINSEHAISDMPLREQMQDAYPTIPVANQGMSLRSDALVAVERLFEEGQRAGVGPFHLASGFRDRMRQAAIYEQVADSTLVQPPGHSEHHTGLAADIVPTNLVQEGGSLNDLLDGTSACERWLAENSWRFGLILRYPQGSESITGISFEPWHFRYVGKPHAWYMWQHELTLEEYLDRIEEKGGFDVTIEQHKYSVRFVPLVSGVVYVPDDLGFVWSTDNRGGSVITATNKR